jgi:putative oxidoreductase
MKIVMIIVRTLMGALFLFAAVSYFFKLGKQPVLTGNPKVFMDGLVASVYLWPLIKGTELVCAIALLAGRFVPLATIVLFPTIVNIVLYHYYLGPSELPMAVAILLADLFIAYYYRANYKGLFAAK